MTRLALPAVSFSMAGAVANTGIGETNIRAAIRDGDLIAHYVGTKVIIRAADLDEYIANLPTERVGG